MHTQADGLRLLELRNSLGHQTARPRESRPSTYSRGRSRRPSPRRLCARSVLHSSDGSDGFMTWSMLLGRFLSFRGHPAGDANGTGFAPPEAVPFLGPSRPSQFQRASTRNPRYVGCLLEPLSKQASTSANDMSRKGLPHAELSFNPPNYIPPDLFGRHTEGWCRHASLRKSLRWTMFAPCSASPFGPVSRLQQTSKRRTSKNNASGRSPGHSCGSAGNQRDVSDKTLRHHKDRFARRRVFLPTLSVPVYILRTNAIQHNAHDWSCFAVLSFELETVFGIRIDPPSVARPEAATYSRRLSRSLPLRPWFLGDATCVTSCLQKRYAARTPIPWPKCHMRRRHSTSKLQAIRPSIGDPFEIGGGAPSASDGGQIFCIREKHIREVRPQSSWQMDCGCATAGALTLKMLRRPGLITAGDIGHALAMSDDKKFRRNVPPKRSLALAAAGIVPRRRGAVE
ncbi:hypothetical protein CNYM01_07905 [Colletotrichum nymphaeae SA-01]|uniref:Uncharacterized protein n=1 Tax=Colletotrichum nymphaeae SA-01 TaxID=1460502 RepID=A0A135THT2_9PEZI|nr:hypothetical protein CNYM01_07905 [Colletotrichum nymphaeae SA-01]